MSERQVTDTRADLQMDPTSIATEAFLELARELLNACGKRLHGSQHGAVAAALKNGAGCEVIARLDRATVRIELVDENGARVLLASTEAVPAFGGRSVN